MSQEINNISKLFKKKCINVPVIQRDYAQGRQEDYVDSIRANFILSLFKAVRDKQKMDINYIYGINKQGDSFLPIDGQQRLTSIFLFLWFCSVKEEKTKDFCKHVKSFSYMVRSTAEEFFDVLQKRENGNLKYLDDFKFYVENADVKLQNFSWFRFEWKNDMTVRGAITFLDNVKEFLSEHSEYDFGSYTDLLLDDDDCPITLVFVVQNEEIRSDALPEEKERAAFEAENRAAITYINMNERGKILNDFENMKALLYKTNDKAKEFIENYDNNYINVFMAMVEAREKMQKLSLAQKVTLMDQLALSFILNTFNDFEIVKGEEKKYTYYQFMDHLRSEPSFRDDYFEFMTFILENYNKYDDAEKDTLYRYSSNYNNPVRYAFYVTFWDKYKKLCVDNYWNVFKKHLNLEEIGLSATDAKEYKYLVSLINLLSGELQKDSSKRMLSVLAEMNTEMFYESITEQNKNYQEIIDKATLKEEKIKAGLILSEIDGWTEDSIADLLEECGKSHRYKIRYLLYISGLWNLNIDVEKWKKLLKYIEVDNQIFASGKGLVWNKIFYLSGLLIDAGGKKDLPPKTALTVWKKDFLYWKKEIIEASEQAIMQRIKICFDRILDDNSPENVLQKEMQLLENDKRIWLYYVLEKPYEDLLVNDITCVDGYYRKSLINFHEYVLCHDLRHRGVAITSQGNCLEAEQCVFNSGIEHKDGDGFSNKKNMHVILRVKYTINKEEYTYFQKEQSIYRLKFSSFDENKEDVFVFEEDSSSRCQFETETAELSSRIEKIVRTFVYDDYYEWVFRGDCKSLQEKLEEEEIICRCFKEGQNYVVISINREMDYNPKVFGNMLSHSEIEKEFS